ncbi:MAG: hypothetical protein AAF266_16535 [Planctomycetota bacterium]
MADRIPFAAVKRSTNGDQRSSVSVIDLFAYRCGCITNLSTSNFTDRFGKDGWHTDSQTLNVGGEALGRWVRLDDDSIVWETFGVMLRGGDKTCPVRDVHIGPSKPPHHDRPAVSDANVEPVSNVYDAGWGNLDAPSLLPMLETEWVAAMRQGFRRDLLPEDMR